jgi:hypothetical protein
MKSCLYTLVTGALHMDTKTDAEQKWRKDRTIETLISKFFTNYMLNVWGYSFFRF